MLRVRQQNLINIHRRSLRREQVTKWRHRDLINIHEMGVLNGRRLLILNNPGELSTAHRHASERKHCAFSSNTTTSLIYIYLERRILCTLPWVPWVPCSAVFCLCFAHWLFAWTLKSDPAPGGVNTPCFKRVTNHEICSLWAIYSIQAMWGWKEVKDRRRISVIHCTDMNLRYKTILIR